MADLTPEQWADLANALGHERKSDSAPLWMDGERLVELVRELRDNQETTQSAYEHARDSEKELTAHVATLTAELELERQRTEDANRRAREAASERDSALHALESERGDYARLLDLLANVKLERNAHAATIAQLNEALAEARATLSAMVQVTR